MKLQPLLEAQNHPIVFDEALLDFVDDKIEAITLPNALLKERAGPKHIASTIASIMHNLDGRASASTQLQAAKIAAELAGLDRGKEASNISIIIQGDNIQLNQLFNPTR